MSKNKNNFSAAVALIIGTSVGAGVFGIPYAILKVGFLYGLIYFIVLGTFIVVTTLCYTEVVVRTKKKMFLPGYAKKYLGKWGKFFGITSMVIGIYSALIAYTIGVGDFLYNLLSPYLGGSERIYAIIFYVICATIVFFGIKAVAKTEKIMVFLLLVMMAIFVIIGFTKLDLSNLMVRSGANFADYIMPYGVLLFALGASSVVPEVEELLKNDKKRIKKAVILGITVPILIYVIFAFIVVGVNGLDVTESSVVGLSQELGDIVLVVGGIFGILAMTTSFLSLGVVLKDTYQQDYKIKKPLAWGLVVIVPMVIYLLNFVSFVQVLAIAGTIMGGIEGILMVLMYIKSKKQGDEPKPAFSLKIPKVFLLSMMVVFIVGLIYQVVILI